MNWLYELDMGKVAREQVNFNTVLLMFLTALVTLGVHKADKAFTQITILTVEHQEMDRRVSNIESELGIIAPPSLVQHPKIIK